MTALNFLYFAIAFIFAMLMVSRLILIKSRTDINIDETMYHAFIVMCVCFIAWSLNIVLVGISQSDVLDGLLLYLCEFLRIMTFVYGAELCATITDRFYAKSRSIRTITAELLYLGVAVIIVWFGFNRAETVSGPFGTNLLMKINIPFLMYAFYYVIVLFFYSAYIYVYFYANQSKRERYISRQAGIIVLIFIISLCVEVVCYAQFKLFVPAVYMGMMAAILLFRDLIMYKRSIEYNESDYDRILLPSYEKPAFVCDDEGRIIFENTRAFVMRQTYRDEYLGKLLTDIFDITDYDKERLKEPRMTQFFSVYCKYEKEEREMLLTVKHNLDKFGAIFSTEVEVGYSEDTKEAPVTVTANTEKIAEAGKIIRANVSLEDVSSIRTKELIKLLENQKRYYEAGNKSLFEFNINGIEKSSSVLGLLALQELCDRIKVELMYGEWEGLNPMMIDLDRQCETLKFLNY